MHKFTAIIIVISFLLCSLSTVFSADANVDVGVIAKANCVPGQLGDIKLIDTGRMGTIKHSGGSSDYTEIYSFSRDVYNQYCQVISTKECPADDRHIFVNGEYCEEIGGVSWYSVGLGILISALAFFVIRFFKRNKK